MEQLNIDIEKFHPWNVKNIEDFLFLCCPECEIKTKNVNNFIDHAISEHSSSYDHVNNVISVNNVKSKSECLALDTKKLILGTYKITKPCETCEYYENMKTHVTISKVETIIKTEEEDVQYQITDLPPIQTTIEESQEFNNQNIDDIGHTIGVDFGEDWLEIDHFNESEEKENECKNPMKIPKFDPQNPNCEYCDFTLTSRATQLYHMRKFHPSKMPQPTRKTRVTGKSVKIDTFDTLDTNESVKITVKEKILQCDYCDQKFFTKFARKKHEQKYHGKYKNEIITKSENPKPLVKCQFCDFSSKIAKLVRKHIVKNHGFCDISETGYKCRQCDQVFIKGKMRDFLFHLTKDHKIGNFQHFCDQCPQSFKSKNVLNSHIKNVHQKIKRKTVEKSCDICAKVFTSHEGYDGHMKSVHNEYKITAKHLVKSCDKCDTKFTEPQNFDEHVKICLHQNKNFKCKFCDTNWNSNSSLEFHMVIDHKKILHVCDICGVILRDRTSLNKHKKSIHENVFDCVCDICAKPIRTNALLKKQLANNHNIGDKKHLCDICGKGFTDNFTLKQHHLQVHVRIKSFQCEKCDWVGYTPSKLHQHMQTKHIRDKIYPCELCDYKAYRKDWLKQHMKVHVKKD